MYYLGIYVTIKILTGTEVHPRLKYKKEREMS